MSPCKNWIVGGRQVSRVDGIAPIHLSDWYEATLPTWLLGTVFQST
jgi:hypothetical protein